MKTFDDNRKADVLRKHDVFALGISKTFNQIGLGMNPEHEFILSHPPDVHRDGLADCFNAWVLHLAQIEDLNALCLVRCRNPIQIALLER